MTRAQKNVPEANLHREFTVLIERDEEGWYVASVPELHGCHTQARSLDVLSNRVNEVISLALEVGGQKWNTKPTAQS